MSAHVVRFLAGASLCLAAAGASADQAPETHSLYLNLLAGGQHFDSNAVVDDGLHTRFGVGFRFSDTWSGELSAGRGETTSNTLAATPINADVVQIDALRHITGSSRWQPYIVVGLGQEEFDVAGGGTPTATIVNAGAGLFRRITGPLFLRIDARMLYVADYEAVHSVALIGLGVDFGGNYDGLPPTP